jgi:ribokinase
LIYSSDEFPQPNSTVELKDRRQYYGGTAANLVRIAASLGVKTALASFVGTEFPKDFMAALRKSGVDVTDLVKVKGERTPFIIIISDKSHNQIGFVDQGAMKVADRLPVRTHTADSSRFVHLGTGRPAYTLKVAKRAKKKHKTVCFDPAQELHYVYSPETVKPILENCDILFLNSAELARLRSYMNLQADEELLSYVDMVVNTRGEEGSRILTEDDDILVGSIQPDAVVDTTGAGDGFRAGFFAGLSRSLPLEECAWIGAAAASFVVESAGAQTNLPTWEMVQRRASRRKSV